MWFNPKKTVCLLFLMFLCITESVYAKLQFGIPSHAEDLSRLLTGKGYDANGGKGNIFLTGFTHIMSLSVDSTHKTDGEPMRDVNKAIEYLNQYQNKLKIRNLPNVKEYLTPGGNTHGVYTHLGWDHIYPDDDKYQGRWMIRTNTRWLIRKKFLSEFLGNHFNFFLNNKKRDSFAALLYYVHILGDHEDNDVKTAHTRIPIKSLDEQINDPQWRGWYEYDTRWKPQTTIILELNKHIPIIFRGQENTRYYRNIVNGLNGTFLPENQKEKARWILGILFDNVPYLLKNESFAKGFYNNMLK